MTDDIDPTGRWIETQTFVEVRPPNTGDAATEAAYGLPEPGPAHQLPVPTDPMACARVILQHAAHDNTPPYRYWRGEFYQHAGTHWEMVDRTMIHKWLYRHTENAWYTKMVKGVPEPRNWSPDRRKIGNLSHALSDGLLAYDGEEHQCIALQNGTYNLKTGRVDPHTPNRFNLTALPYAHDPEATCPRWLQFLNEVLPGDTEAHQFLAEWFGYLLSGRTDIHKMVSLVGHPRCGKGTIGRTAVALLGQTAVASPTLNTLAGNFGEEPLIGRKLAIMSDVRWNVANAAEAVAALLAITGEDSRTVHRKNRTAWNGYLPTRFMAMSNDMPTFRDASGALAGRMMQVQFTQSFAGREDPGLTDKLLQELPGIFNWAIEGLHRLNQRGRFQPPASGQELADEVRRNSSPYQAFIEDFCELDDTAETPAIELLRAYQQWAREVGRTTDNQTEASLSKGLRTSEQRITRVPERLTLPNGRKVTLLRGIRVAVAPTWLAADRQTDHDAYQQGEQQYGRVNGTRTIHKIRADNQPACGAPATGGITTTPANPGGNYTTCHRCNPHQPALDEPHPHPANHGQAATPTNNATPARSHKESPIEEWDWPTSTPINHAAPTPAAATTPPPAGHPTHPAAAGPPTDQRTPSAPPSDPSNSGGHANAGHPHTPHT